MRFLKAGTLERLVESLASDTGELESTFVNVFLATYRTFASTAQVLNLVLDRYLALDAGRATVPKHLIEDHKKYANVILVLSCLVSQETSSMRITLETVMLFL